MRISNGKIDPRRFFLGLIAFAGHWIGLPVGTLAIYESLSEDFAQNWSLFLGLAGFLVASLSTLIIGYLARNE